MRYQTNYSALLFFLAVLLMGNVTEAGLYDIENKGNLSQTERVEHYALKKYSQPDSKKRTAEPVTKKPAKKIKHIESESKIETESTDIEDFTDEIRTWQDCRENIYRLEQNPANEETRAKLENNLALLPDAPFTHCIVESYEESEEYNASIVYISRNEQDVARAHSQNGVDFFGE